MKERAMIVIPEMLMIVGASLFVWQIIDLTLRSF